MEVVSVNYTYAGFTKRLLAFIVDRILIWLLLYAALGYAMDFHLYNLHNLLGFHTIMIDIFVYIYFVVCETSSWQGTLGKHLLGMKVVNEQYGKVTAAQAMWRFTWKYLSGLIFMLGFIWVIFDPKKQGWHDKLAKTYVIEF